MSQLKKSREVTNNGNKNLEKILAEQFQVIEPA